MRVWRHYLVVSIVLLTMLGLAFRMYQLMVLQRPFLLNQGDARTIRYRAIPAYRGMITDRFGEPLAISSPVESVWLNPKEIDIHNPKLQQLTKTVAISYGGLIKKIQTNMHREFLYVRRGLNPALAHSVKALNIKGVYLRREYKRYYPEGEVFSHVVGFNNIDDKGQEGIEYAYNDWLQGLPGKKKILKDRLGHVVQELGVIQAPKAGHDLVLSLDKRIQYLAYRVLKEAVSEHQAKSGSVVVLDPNTGEILAMVNQPAFNPNVRPRDTHGRYRNRAITDIFEPGSTIKSFSVANALMSGKFTPDTLVDTSPGWMMLDGKEVHDEHNHGAISVTTILQKSSNMGVAKLTLALPANSLWTLLHNLGFGQLTGSGFPGESPGLLPAHPLWSKITRATLSFGYGIAVTDLQLARAYAALARGGVLKPTTFIKQMIPSSGQRVMPASVAKQILQMLQTVMEQGGTAPLARVPGYHVTGKTGTTRMIGDGGYERNHHTAIFVGVAPVKHPRLVVSVEIADPQGWQYYGGLVAAPVFSKIMAGSLRILDVAPDYLKN